MSSASKLPLLRSRSQSTGSNGYVSFADFHIVLPTRIPFASVQIFSTDKRLIKFLSSCAHTFAVVAAQTKSYISRAGVNRFNLAIFSAMFSSRRTI